MSSTTSTNLVYASAVNQLYCVDALNGAIVWTTTLAQAPPASLVASAAGIVYSAGTLYACYRGNVYALNATTGSVTMTNLSMWPLDYVAYPTLAVDTARGLLYVGLDSRVCALSLSTLDVVWTVGPFTSSSGHHHTTPVVVTPPGVLTGAFGAASLLNFSDGSVAHTQDFPSTGWGVMCAANRGGGTLAVGFNGWYILTDLNLVPFPGLKYSLKYSGQAGAVAISPSGLFASNLGYTVSKSSPPGAWTQSISTADFGVPCLAEFETHLGVGLAGYYVVLAQSDGSVLATKQLVSGPVGIINAGANAGTPIMIAATGGAIAGLTFSANGNTITQQWQTSLGSADQNNCLATALGDSTNCLQWALNAGE